MFDTPPPRLFFNFLGNDFAFALPDYFRLVATN